MRNASLMLGCLFGLIGVGCACEGTERVAPAAMAASPASPEREAEPSPTVPAVARAGMPSVPSAPQAPASPGQPTAPMAAGAVTNTETMQQVGEVIEAALAAGAAVPTSGGDRCSLAYSGLEAMSDHVRRAMPEMPAHPLPPRDSFLEECRTLPQEVQQCLVVSYALEHQAECARHAENLDPTVRARMEDLMNTAP